MPRTTARLILALILVLGLGGFYWYYASYRQGKADDLTGMQGVPVCTASKDSEPGTQSCPAPPKLVTNCAEARAALVDLGTVTLASQVNDPLLHAVECELKTVDQANGLYAVVIRGYYPAPAPAATFPPIKLDTFSRPTLDRLYAIYANLYQAHPIIDSPTTASTSYKPFTAAFLVKGEPGFRIAVTTLDENGNAHPGAATQIKISCGTSSDTMTAEPNGNSWFSFAGYEKLNCNGQAPTAEIVVDKYLDGQWVPGTPSYSYTYEPIDAQKLVVQNRPEPAQLTFLGRWQGIGIRVQVTSPGLDGTPHTTPISGATVQFSCDQRVSNPSPSENIISLTQKTNANGRASLALADAQLSLQGCQDNFVAKLSDQSSLTADYFFDHDAQVATGRISGDAFAESNILGYELVVGGVVKLADVGSTPGGNLGGSTVCLFYTKDAASSIKGCPANSTATSLAIQTNQKGEYLFNGSNRISYSKYVSAGSQKPLLRIVNYKNEAYPDAVIANSDAAFDPKQLNYHAIQLPSSQNDLHDDVCLAVLQTWKTTNECAPLFNIITQESTWNVAASNGSSGAFGLFQALPKEKYQQTALPGESPYTITNQIRWGVQYVQARYGTPTKAWAFWQTNNSY